MRSCPCRGKTSEGLFEAMEGRPVTIRLLDPPLHEFLPQDEDDIEALAKELGISADELKNIKRTSMSSTR